MPMKNKDEQRAYQREWLRQRRKDWIDENGPCACGSSDRLEVDHIDPKTKTMKASQIWSRREEVRNAELSKCQVLCYVCHKKKTAKDLSDHFTIQRACGTHQKYAQGCRCDSCTEALRVYWRERRAKNKGS
jgi:hypothetical protein